MILIAPLWSVITYVSAGDDSVLLKHNAVPLVFICEAMACKRGNSL